MKKYKMNINHLETAGGIAKLERDGFNRHDVHRVLYQETKGATQQQRTEIIERLYQRDKPC